MSEESEVLELAEEETDSAVRKYATENKVFLLSCIAPFKPLKVSPASVIYAELSPPEEFAVESLINRVKEVNIPRDQYSKR